MVRKIAFILFGLLFLASPCFAGTDYFLDLSHDQANGGDGTTMETDGGADDAFKTFAEVIAANLSAGDVLWIRRVTNVTQSADIAPDDDGTAAAPIYWIGWPRDAIPNTTITQATITNGSTFIDDVVGITPDREQHVGRWATLPDGFQYLITAVLWEAGVDGMAAGDEFTVTSHATNTTQTRYGRIYGFTDDLDTTGTIQYSRSLDSSWVENDNITDADGGDAEIDAGGESAVGFIIDRPYAGTTVSGVNGKFKIEADELPTGVSEPNDTDNWSSDNDDLALIDFNDGDFNLVFHQDDCYQLRNLEIKDSTDSDGLYKVDNVKSHTIIGCLMAQNTQDDDVLYIYNDAYAALERCIIEGTGATAASAVRVFKGGVDIRNSALFGINGYAIEGGGWYCAYLENVNIGEEIRCGNDNIMKNQGSRIIGRDVKLDGTNGYVKLGAFWDSKQFPHINDALIFSNYQKVLGAYKEWGVGVELEKKAVTSTNANKKLSDDVLEITPYTDSTFQFAEIDHKYKAWESRKTYDADTYNIKVWIYNDTGNTLNDTTFSDDICMRCRAEAGNYGDATTEYVSMPWTYSDEIDILDAADADDWDYLQCDSVVVDTNDSRIYCEILVSTYDADADVILIDPQSANP